MSLENLVEMSHRYGGNEEFVLAGGGNTSFKENGVLHVKGSGVQLSDILPEQFVAMDIKKLLDMVEREYPASMSNAEREENALSDMMAARLPGEEEKRPSVESILHAMFPFKYVLHVHPPLINGLTCGVGGKAACYELFGDKAVWIDLTKPGLVLAQACSKVFKAYVKDFGCYPQIVILQNHGIFVAADSVVEIDKLMAFVVDKLKSFVKDVPDFGAIPPAYGTDSLQAMSSTLKAVYSSSGDGSGDGSVDGSGEGSVDGSGDGSVVAKFCANKQVSLFVKDKEAFKPVSKPFSPDHIVNCKDEPLFIETDADISAEFAAYTKRKGFKPKIVAVRGLGFFALGETKKSANRAEALFLDAIKIATYAKSFGGANPLDNEFADFILNWEVEAYRSKA